MLSCIRESRQIILIFFKLVLIYRNWKTAKQCSDITQLSCNLTEDFKDIFAYYSVLVQRFTGTEVLNSSVLHFVPLSDSKFSVCICSF